MGAQARALGGDLTGTDPVADLLAQYGTATDDESRALLLKALGNSGDPRALEAIRTALDSQALGAAAAYSLRFIPGTEVDALIHQLVTGAADPIVRRAACAAAGYRDAGLWTPWLESALAVETDPQVKAAIEGALHRARRRSIDPRRRSWIAAACKDSFVAPSQLEAHSSTWATSLADVCEPNEPGPPEIVIGQGEAAYAPLDAGTKLRLDVTVVDVTGDIGPPEQS